MSNKTVYLISGANRGIGFGLVATLAARPDDIVFAGTRDPAAKSLSDLAAKHPNVHAVKLTSGDKADNEAAITKIRDVAGQLDIIIANAAIATHVGPIATTPLDAFRDHFEVNTLGPIVLFQAAHTLLLASPTGAPVFAIISSLLGSMGRYLPVPATPYGVSKAAANYLVKALDAQNPELITMSIEPGWVATDMGNAAAEVNEFGIAQAPVSVDESAAGILSRIDGATKEKSSGRFWNFKVAQDNPWDIETEEVPW
ncbi:hypothetical protein B0H19DRAFT_984126 [Mycena capillaripes]|nr:hypothetical protein B0H19DRAFT_984126 [Mycena capillaripes]